MGQISNSFKKQLSKAHLNLLYYENTELKISGVLPLQKKQMKATASFVMKHPLSKSSQPKVMVLFLTADAQLLALSDSAGKLFTRF